MENIKKILQGYQENFDKLNKQIVSLQDLVLHMKTEFSLLSRNKLENECIAKLTEVSQDNLEIFIKQRPKNCKYLDPCTTLIEKSILDILMIYIKKGAKQALKRIKNSQKYAEKYLEIGRCPDGKCMRNISDLYNTLTDLLVSSNQLSEDHTKVLFSEIRKQNLLEGNEKDETQLIAPLSNIIRLKILKILSKGGMYYTQLERQMGIKGGHFHFHLDKLIEAGYVSPDADKGPYLITTNGLKALKFIYELKENLIVIHQPT